jgi:hypothetical protein
LTFERRDPLDVARVGPARRTRFAQPKGPAETSDRVPERAGPIQWLRDQR